VKPTFNRIRDRILLAMDYRGLTQRALARRAGLAETQMSVILKRLETHPYAIELETLGRISVGAEVPFLWLLTGLNEQDVLTPPTLANLPGWNAAANQVDHHMPGVEDWIWDWVAGIRLPDVPLVYPSPWLVNELLRLAIKLFGVQPRPLEEPAEEVLALPPATKRPRSPKRSATKSKASATRSKASTPKGKSGAAKSKASAPKNKAAKPKSRN
jgi:transcriptional regulator with XRE-family HTH domain